VLKADITSLLTAGMLADLSAVNIDVSDQC
jgi:hypothetical protein